METYRKKVHTSRGDVTFVVKFTCEGIIVEMEDPKTGEELGSPFYNTYEDMSFEIEEE